jgi:hypothetical protein
MHNVGRNTNGANIAASVAVLYSHQHTRQGNITTASRADMDNDALAAGVISDITK